MKKSLLLGLSVLVLSTGLLASCGESSSSTGTSSETPTEVPTEVPTEAPSQETYNAISELLYMEPDDESGTYLPAYLGKQVKIKAATVVTVEPHQMYIQQTEGESVNGIYSIQVINEDIDFTADFQPRFIVDVEGTIGYVEGRIVVEKALPTIIDTENPSVYYWPDITKASVLMLNGTNSGVMVTTTVQVAEAPGKIIPGEEKIFKVVYPGEDTNVANPDNNYWYEFRIPALSEKEAAEANKIYENLQVNDGFYTCVVLHWNDVDWQLMYIPGLGADARYNAKVELKGVYTDFASLSTQYLRKRTTAYEEILDMGYEKDGEQLVFSFVGDDTGFDPKSADPKFKITLNSYLPGTVFKGVTDRYIADENWTVLDDSRDGELTNGIPFIAFEQTNKNHIIAFELNGDDDFGGSVLVQIITRKPYVPMPLVNHATWDEAKTTLNDFVFAFADKNRIELVPGKFSYKTQLIDIKDVLTAEQSVNNYIVSKMKETSYLNKKIEAAHEEIRFQLNVTDEAKLNEIVEAYKAKLVETAGFVRTTNPAYPDAPEGLYNVKTGEWISDNMFKVQIIAAKGDKPEMGQISFFVDVLDLDLGRKVKGTLPEEKPEA